jgi:hypothetical protein
VACKAPIRKEKYFLLIVTWVFLGPSYIDKKENQIFLIYKEDQKGSVAKSYMTNGLLIYDNIFALFLVY